MLNGAGGRGGGGQCGRERAGEREKEDNSSVQASWKTIKNPFNK